MHIRAKSVLILSFTYTRRKEEKSKNKNNASLVPGFAVGGLSGGEAKSEFWKIVKVRPDF